MHPERRVRLSKFLSLILRHRPEQVGVALDAQGRVPVDLLLAALHANGWEDLTVQDLAAVVGADARRFELDQGMIRARYGHTLMLERPGPAVRPPEWLYLAVPEGTLGDVATHGLRPAQRQFVHLCATPQEAARLLERRQVRGPVIAVLARRAHDEGLPFFQAAEHLYLTPRVPAGFLHLPVGAMPAAS